MHVFALNTNTDKVYRNTASTYTGIYGIPKIQEGQSTLNSQQNPAKSIEKKCLNCTLHHLRTEVVQMQGARCVTCPPAMYTYLYINDRLVQPDSSVYAHQILSAKT